MSFMRYCEMKKMLVACKNMNVGGVEQSLLSFLNSLDRTQYEVDLLLLERTGNFIDGIPSWIHVIEYRDYRNIQDELNNPPIHSIIKNIKQKKWIKSMKLAIAYAKTKFTQDYYFFYQEVFKTCSALTKTYDIAIAYSSLMTYLTWIVMYKVRAKKYIGWIHFDIQKMGFNKKVLLRLHQPMSTIYIVSQEALQHFIDAFPQLKDKTQLKYNIINEKQILEKANQDNVYIKKGNKKILVTLGRLTREKGQDIIPEIVYELKKKNYDIAWYIIGKGALAHTIKEGAAKLGVSDAIYLLGEQKNPYPYLKQADVYVQTSIHEGFCITLAEAKLFGMPIVSTRFTGAAEQLINRSDCLIVERNTRDLTNAIERTLKNYVI